VLPDRAYGPSNGEQVLLQTTGAAPELKAAGTLDGWRSEISTPARGNSRLMLAIGTALAGPLLYLLGEESGGFHLFGPSSIGKTTAAHVARSVWAMPLGSWRTTDNGAEGLARGGEAPEQLASALSKAGGGAAHVAAVAEGEP
jgi:putative DNA primase/helicase